MIRFHSNVLCFDASLELPSCFLILQSWNRTLCLNYGKKASPLPKAMLVCAMLSEVLPGPSTLIDGGRKMGNLDLPSSKHWYLPGVISAVSMGMA